MRLTAVAAALLASGALLAATLPGVTSQPTSQPRARAVAAPEAVPRGTITTEAGLRAAWADPLRSRIDLGADISLHNCFRGDPIRESPYPMNVDGHGHVLRQTCFEKRLLRQDGTGYLTLRNITLTRGGADGPGAALTSRGEISIYDSVVKQNLSEEPGGGVFSMRRVDVHRSRIDGNLANDDGGGVYARRGGVQVYDSVLSNNLVDGSGGAIGSTGDILVVRSQVDGNTTDGDGGALYTDEDGDVTVIDSLVDGSDADGPGGAIFTLDGDVAVLNSTLIGNRADDRGGAVSGEADVLLVNSTVARNLAVAHAGGGIWARGDLMMVNATVTDNYAEGEGGGTLAAGRTTMINSTVTGNIASVGGNIGSAGTFTSAGTIIGPTKTEGVTGDTLPTRRNCRVYRSESQGYNLTTDESCELGAARNILAANPRLAMLEDDPQGFVLRPLPGSPVIGAVPPGQCVRSLPDHVPAGQLLAAYLDWDEVLRHDAIGTPRDTGSRCDIGAVEAPPGPERAGFTPPDVPEAPSFAAARLTDKPDAYDLSPESVGTQKVSQNPRELLGRQLDRLQVRATGLRVLARRFNTLLGCTTPLDVDQLGDTQHRWGFRYDERDGSGRDTRTALARHAGAGRADLRLLRLAGNRGCLSAPTDPNGSGAPARVGHPRSGPAPTLRELKAKVRLLHGEIARVEHSTDQFDEWESCLSWLPVTEDGDARQDLGFLNRAGGSRLRHLPAIDIDATEWDDPDYQLLAFVGRNRPFGSVECETEPGESPDRVIPHHPRRTTTGRGVVSPDDLKEIREAVEEAQEDLEDLVEPVDDITRFDQCLYTVGVQNRGGYVYQGPGGRLSRRATLSFDLRGQHRPQYDLMAFPGEEPPQIECNEDAGGQDTQE